MANSNQLNEFCRQWFQDGTCPYGITCLYATTHISKSPPKHVAETDEQKENSVGSSDDNPNKRLHSVIIKAYRCPESKWEQWDQTDLEDVDAEALEKRRQELQHELELQMKIESKLTKTNDTVKTGSNINLSPNSSDTSSSNSTELSSKSSDSSSNSTNSSSSSSLHSRRRKRHRPTKLQSKKSAKPEKRQKRKHSSSIKKKSDKKKTKTKLTRVIKSFTPVNTIRHRFSLTPPLKSIKSGVKTTLKSTSRFSKHTTITADRKNINQNSSVKMSSRKTLTRSSRSAKRDVRPSRVDKKKEFTDVKSKLSLNTNRSSESYKRDTSNKNASSIPNKNYRSDLSRDDNGKKYKRDEQPVRDQDRYDRRVRNSDRRPREETVGRYQERQRYCDRLKEPVKTTRDIPSVPRNHKDRNIGRGLDKPRADQVERLLPLAEDRIPPMRKEPVEQTTRTRDRSNDRDRGRNRSRNRSSLPDWNRLNDRDPDRRYRNQSRYRRSLPDRDTRNRNRSRNRSSLPDRLEFCKYRDRFDRNRSTNKGSEVDRLETSKDRDGVDRNRGSELDRLESYKDRNRGDRSRSTNRHSETDRLKYSKSTNRDSERDRLESSKDRDRRNRNRSTNRGAEPSRLESPEDRERLDRNQSTNRGSETACLKSSKSTNRSTPDCLEYSKNRDRHDTNRGSDPECLESSKSIYRSTEPEHLSSKDRDKLDRNRLTYRGLDPDHLESPGDRDRCDQKRSTNRGSELDRVESLKSTNRGSEPSRPESFKDKDRHDINQGSESDHLASSKDLNRHESIRRLQPDHLDSSKDRDIRVIDKGDNGYLEFGSYYNPADRKYDHVILNREYKLSTRSRDDKTFEDKNSGNYRRIPLVSQDFPKESRSCQEYRDIDPELREEDCRKTGVWEPSKLRPSIKKAESESPDYINREWDRSWYRDFSERKPDPIRTSSLREDDKIRIKLESLDLVPPIGSIDNTEIKKEIESNDDVPQIKIWIKKEPAYLEDSLSEISDEADAILNREDDNLEQEIEIPTECESTSNYIKLVPKFKHILEQSPHSPAPSSQESVLVEDGVDNMNYEEISDEELEEIKVKDLGDVLGVDWSSLVAESHPKVKDKTGSAKKWQYFEVLKRIGISLEMAGEQLAQQIFRASEDYELQFNNNEKKVPESVTTEMKFIHPVAMIQVALNDKQNVRNNLFTSAGMNRRVISARRELKIRRHLCNLPINENFTELLKTPDLQLFKTATEMVKRYVI